MKILTMNLWHGLSPSSVLAFERLEPDSRRHLREEIQVKLFKEIDADVAFFQEVNPVTGRFHHLCKELGRHGVFQPDLVGIKLLGFGLPLHLYSGLVMLTRPSWLLRKIGAVRLSGQGRSFVHSFASFQLEEERFALFAETSQPGIGPILLINTHLHHGLEATEAFIEKLTQAMGELDLSVASRSELRDRMLAANERRSKEMTVLLKEMQRWQAKYSMIILGGDFNSEPESEIGQRLREMGFTDVWHKAHPNEVGFTFDRVNNIANHILQDRFPSSFMVEDLSCDPKVKERLEHLGRDQERRPRRIDQLWVRTVYGKTPSVKCRLVGLPDSQGLAPSDHFGLVTDIEMK